MGSPTLMARTCWTSFPRSTASVFTHGDIKPKNIIVDGEGKILGLLDWEMSGFLPDYWESVGMFSRVLEDQVERAEVMQRTWPKNWDFDVTWVTKARRVLL
jgi:aminoglycoside phosphotransferase (APT) family kinase protein